MPLTISDTTVDRKGMQRSENDWITGLVYKLHEHYSFGCRTIHCLHVFWKGEKETLLAVSKRGNIQYVWILGV
jgi:hypothetical protein